MLRSFNDPIPLLRINIQAVQHSPVSKSSRDDAVRKPLLPQGMNLVNWLIGGWTGVIVVFLYLPIALLIAFSFNKSALNIRWEGFTTQWYEAVITNKPESLEEVSPANRRRIMGQVPKLRMAVWNSVMVAGISTVLSVGLGTAGAWLMYRYRFPLSRLVNTMVAVPMIIPEIIMGVSLLILFASLRRYYQGFELGLLTVVLAHVTFCFPYVLITVQARLAGLDPSLEEAALDLGATPVRAFRLVIVPFLLPAIVSGGLMSFTLSLDDFVVTYFCKGASFDTLPLQVYGSLKTGLNPTLNVVSTFLIIGTALLVVAAEWVRQRSVKSS